MSRPAGKNIHRSEHRPLASASTKEGVRNPAVWCILLIIACSFTAYSNSLTNGYAYDDLDIIVKNPNIRSFESVVSSLHSYRPIRWFTFALDYQLWGLDPFGYHLSNVLLHAVCSVLVFWVARLIIRDLAGALIVSLLFCAHPVTTEAVGNISNRNELLGTIFSLSALLFYIKRSARPLFIVAVLPLHILALMSKEAIAVSLPLLFIASMPLSTMLMMARSHLSGSQDSGIVSAVSSTGPT